MTPKTNHLNSRKLVLILTLLVSLGIYWILNFRGKSPEDSEGGVSTRRNVVRSGDVPPSKARTATVSEIIGSRRTRVEMDAMIANSSDKLGATVAAVFLSLDDHYLDLLKQYPDSQKACLVLACFGANPADRLEWSRRLKKLDPSNAAGSLAEIVALFHQKKKGEAAALLPELAQQRSIRYSEKEIFSDIHSAWIAMGYDRDKAAELTINNSFTGTATNLFGSSLRAVWKLQTDSGGEAEKISAASLQLQLVQQFKTDFRGSIATDEATMRWENDALKLLPEDVEYGQDGLTVKDRLAQILEEQKQIGKDIMFVGQTLGSVPEDVMVKYRDKTLLEGEKAARAWIISLYGKP